MSTRQSREELIKKGLLKEVYEKGEAPHSEGEKESGQCCSISCSLCLRPDFDFRFKFKCKVRFFQLQLLSCDSCLFSCTLIGLSLSHCSVISGVVLFKCCSAPKTHASLCTVVTHFLSVSKSSDKFTYSTPVSFIMTRLSLGICVPV